MKEDIQKVLEDKEEQMCNLNLQMKESIEVLKRDKDQVIEKL